MPWWVLPPTLWALALLLLPSWQEVSRRSRREGSRRGLSGVTGSAPSSSPARTGVVPRDATGGFAPPFPLGRASRAPHPTTSTDEEAA